MQKNKITKCGVCRKPIKGHWHNGLPITTKPVCDGCNYGFVIPARLQSMGFVIKGGK